MEEDLKIIMNSTNKNLVEEAIRLQESINRNFEVYAKMLEDYLQEQRKKEQKEMEYMQGDRWDFSEIEKQALQDFKESKRRFEDFLLGINSKSKIMNEDEMIAVITAHKEGKTIECRRKSENANWHPISDPKWDFASFVYRIKPEPNIRPYKDAQEFLKAMKEHGPYYTKKEIRIGRVYMCPGYVYNCAFGTNNGTTCSFEDFAIGCEWEDGTPCGIEEEAES